MKENQIDKTRKTLVKAFYQHFYSRWPDLNSSHEKILLKDLKQNIWEEYSKILDNGNGIRSLTSLKRLIDDEITDLYNHIDGFPDEADDIYKTKLKDIANLLGLRKSIIQKLLTQFAVHGSVMSFSDVLKDRIERFKYENYYDTAIQIKNESGLTWAKTFTAIEHETKELGIENKHSTYESFFTSIKRYKRGN